MIPRSLSASSISVAEACLARWQAENHQRSERLSGNAALLGTSVHAGLEKYVDLVYIQRQHEKDFKLLEMFYQTGFLETFGHLDKATREYKEGLKMIRDWIDRTNFDGIEVLSVEKKETFQLPTSAGPIPFNYIFDRLDRLENGDIRVVDYKSSAWPLKPEDLERKIQARVYALVARMKFKDEAPERVWVQFDMLRHTPVARMFSVDECRETWQYLKRAAERIIHTPDDEAPETLNDECRFCIRVANCGAVMSNTVGGGTVNMPVEEAIDRLAQLAAKKSALESAINTLQDIIKADAQAYDWTERQTDRSRVSWKSQQRRQVDAAMISPLLTPDQIRRYTRQQMTMKDFDMLITDPDLDPTTRNMLNGMVTKYNTAPSIKAEIKKPSEGSDD